MTKIKKFQNNYGILTSYDLKVKFWMKKTCMCIETVWWLISECERRVRIGQEHEFEILLLASFPGSGNTWVRLLLEDATGIYTGSVYIDKSLGKSGFLGEYEDQESGTTIAVKCHGFNGMALRGIAKGAILLVRFNKNHQNQINPNI